MGKMLNFYPVGNHPAQCLLCHVILPIEEAGVEKRNIMQSFVYSWKLKWIDCVSSSHLIKMSSQKYKPWTLTQQEVFLHIELHISFCYQISHWFVWFQMSFPIFVQHSNNILVLCSSVFPPSNSLISGFGCIFTFQCYLLKYHVYLNIYLFIVKMFAFKK